MYATFKPGDVAPCGGIYQAHHVQHRLDHCVTILEGEQFPACRKCGEYVRFRLQDSISRTTAVYGRFRVILEEYATWSNKGRNSRVAA